MASKYQECLDIAVKLAKDAGELIIRNIKSKKTIDMKASVIDLVTETDQQVEKLLISGLQQKFPDHRFIGEETTDVTKKVELLDDPTWIIDPIDGTMNFVHSNPNVAVSIGLYVNKKPEVGVIYLPMFGYIYTTLRGKGSDCNGKSLQASGCADLSKALICLEGGSSRDPEKVNTIIENFKTLIPQMHGFRATGSAACNLALVAEGSTDAYVEFGCHAWDMAAGNLLVEEAGGVCIDPAGGPLDIMSGRILAASSEELAKKLSEQLKQYYPKRDDC